MPCTWIDICPLRRLEREGAVDDSWREGYCQSAENWKNCIRYLMERRGEPHADDLLPDGSFARRDGGAAE